MAKYDITRKCGHVETVQIAGPVNDRAYKAEQESEKLCQICFAIKIQAERDAANKTAALEAEKQGLPALTGTEKQISWANTIRQKTLSRQEEIVRLINTKTPEANREQAHAILSKAVKNLENQLSAAWWIENRDLTIEREMKRCM